LADIAVVRGEATKHRKWVPKGLGGPLLVFPMAAWMVLFFLVPLLLIFIYSFGYMGVYDTSVQLTTKTADDAAKSGVYSIQSLHNYSKVISDPLYFKSFYKTVGMVIGNTVGCLILGYPLAYFISRKAGKRKTLFLLLVMLPFWTSFLIRTYAWITILDNTGLLNNLLVWLGIIDKPLSIMYTPWAIAIGLVYDYLPFMVLPLFVSIEKIDRALFEASKDLGAGKWTTFFKVTLPLTVPGIVAGCLLCGIPTTGEFVIPQILGGDKIVVWGYQIYKAINAYRDLALGSALSNILLMVMLAVIVLYVKLWGTEEF
jgi:spermidine/putrescine transport system permease protein